MDNSIRCLSSHLFTPLLAWRNPDGREEGWLANTDTNLDNYPRFVGRVITTELGLLALTILAAIETIAYNVLALATFALSPLISNRPYKFF